MSDNQDEKKPSSSTGEVILQSPGKVAVKHDDLPAKSTDDRKIHPRRPLPLVPEALDDPDSYPVPAEATEIDVTPAVREEFFDMRNPVRLFTVAREVYNVVTRQGIMLSLVP